MQRDQTAKGVDLVKTLNDNQQWPMQSYNEGKCYRSQIWTFSRLKYIYYSTICSSRTDVVRFWHGAPVYIIAMCLAKERPGKITHNRKSPINNLQVSLDNAQYGSPKNTRDTGGRAVQALPKETQVTRQMRCQKNTITQRECSLYIYPTLGRRNRAQKHTK